MAAITIAQVYADVLRIFPDIPQAVFLDYVNEIDADYIQCNVRLTPQVVVPLSLVAAQQEYVIDTTVWALWQVGYLTGPGSGVDLVPTTFDYLDYQMAGWRYQAPGVPAWWYYDGGSIGFYPAPSQGTVGGYPIVNLYVTKQGAAYGIGDSLPGPVHTDYPWVYGVCKLWAQAYYPERVVEFESKFKTAFINLKAYMSGHNIRRKNKRIVRVPQIPFR